MVETRSTPAEKLFGSSFSSLSFAGRDHPVVVGEGAVDQLAGQDRAAEAEADLGRRQRDLDRPLELLEQPVELGDRFARDDHVGHAVGAVGLGDGDPGQPVAVGRGGAQLVVDDVEEDPHQIIARLLAGDGEARLLDDLAKRRGGKLEAGRKLALGDHREIVARQRRQVEARAAGDDLHLALGGGQFDLAALGELADDVEEGVGRNGGRAGLGDVGRHAFVDLQVEVGRHQPDRAVLARLDQHVGQDRDGVAALHDRLDVAEALQEGRPLNRRFHRRYCPIIRALTDSVIASRSARGSGMMCRATSAVEARLAGFFADRRSAVGRRPCPASAPHRRGGRRRW